jgi:hypothetical protein
MIEMTAECQECGATLTLPLPDAWQTPQGDFIDKDRIALEDNEAELKATMEAMNCPSCGHVALRVVGVAEGRPEGVLPVYVQYVIALERYVEVKADSMDEAQAIVKQMILDGQIQRPSYTERLDDWTEITDLPNIRSHFRFDGKAL